MNCVGKGSQKDTEISILVDMNGASVLPADMIPAIAGKKIELTLKMSEGLTWVIHGSDISGEEFPNIDLGVTKDTGEIPEEIIRQVSGGKETLQIALSHRGMFGFSATLQVDLGKNHIGQYANLYDYDEGVKTLNFVEAAQIDADGIASLEFTRASAYVIVIK